jgi:hypothetical protein
MSVLNTGTTYVNNDQVTATNLNQAVNGATFTSAAIDGATTQLSGGAIIVRDGGVTPAKLSTGGPSWTSGGALSATSIQNTPVGSTTRSSGAFTTLTANGAFSLTGDTVQVSEGGTGLSATPSNGQIPIGNGSGYTLAGITAGSGITVTPGAGSITIAATAGGGGTVTSVGVTGNNGISVSGSPVTTSGTITVGLGDITPNKVNTGAGGYEVSGTKVVGAQAAAEGDVSVTTFIVGSDTVDANAVLTGITDCQNKINALLAKLRTHGLIAT